MAINLTFYKDVTKPMNSTHDPRTEPTGEFATYTTVERAVLWKEGTSLTHPAFDFSDADANSNGLKGPLYLFNYVAVGEPIYRCYFIDSWDYDSGMWTCTCSEDVLATYRTDLQLMRAYVNRSAVMWDGDILDTLYPITAKQHTKVQSMIYNPLRGDGTVVVGVASKATSGMGSTAYYALDPSTFNGFCNYLFSNTNWMAITDITEELQKALINPFQYVVSCKFYPLDSYDIIFHGTYVQQVTTIPLGYWNIPLNNISGLITTGFTVRKISTITIPRPTWAAGAHKYKRVAPYASYSLRYFPFGEFEIEPSAIADSNSLTLDANIDITTGESILKIYTDTSDKTFKCVRANIGVNTPLTSSAIDTSALTKETAIVGALGFGIDIGKSFIEGYNEGAGTGFVKDVGQGLIQGSINAIGSIGSAVAASVSKVESIGGSGSIIDYFEEVYLTGDYAETVEEDLNDNGRPLCKTVDLVDVWGGYAEIGSTDLELRGTTEEKTALLSLLRSGVFLA